MVQILINLIAGALGGVATGKASPNFDLIVSQLVAGGAGGAILTAIIGAIKNKAMA